MKYMTMKFGFLQRIGPKMMSVLWWDLKFFLSVKIKR